MKHFLLIGMVLLGIFAIWLVWSVPEAQARPAMIQVNTCAGSLQPCYTVSYLAQVQSADLRISKRGVPNPVVAGQPLTYTLVISNSGVGAAANVNIVDTLPAGVSFVGLSTIQVTNGSGASLLGTPQILTGTVSLLNAGGIVTVTARTRVNVHATGISLVNSAIVTTTTDSNPGNNTATTSNTLITSTPTPTHSPTQTPTPTSTPTPNLADLRVQKTGAPAIVRSGDLVTYTVVVVNQGPAVAENVTVVDSLPPGLYLTGSSQINATRGAGVLLVGNGNILTGTVAELHPNGIITMTVRTLVGAEATGTTLVNQASAATANDPLLANNVATAISTLLAPTTTPPATATPTKIATATEIGTATATATGTATSTATATATATPSPTPSATAVLTTPSPPTPTPTSTPTPLPTLTPEPKLAIMSGQIGKSGSSFLLEGEDFPPGQEITLSIETVEMQKMEIDQTGDFLMTLLTPDDLAEDIYEIGVNGVPSAETEFVIDPQAPLQRPTPQGIPVTVSIYKVYLPITQR